VCFVAGLKDELLKRCKKKRNKEKKKEQKFSE
jgi:hypothetical protein